jgi:hypothetical protein
MTTFAPHRDTLESFVECIHGGADKDTLASLFAEDVVLYSPLGGDPITGRETVVEVSKTVNRMAVEDSYREVFSGPTHHAARYRLQVEDAAIDGIYQVLLNAEGKIAEVTIWWGPLPAAVELQRVLSKVLGMQPWELRTNGE